MKRLTPEPVYLNQKEGAALIKVDEKKLAELSQKGLINRCPRGGKGFVYKIKELLYLAEKIDTGVITL